MRWIAVLFAFVWILAAPAAAQDGSRLALLIGNQDYPSAVGRLSEQPLEDVAAVAAALQEVGFETTVVTDADRAEMMRAVLAFREQLAAADDGVIGFLYYAGHGASAGIDDDRRNYLIPARAEITTAEQLIIGDAVELQRVVDLLHGALGDDERNALFVVMDACRNTLEPAYGARSSATRGFGVMAARPGLFLAYSAPDGSLAPDDGVYASALSEQLTAPGQFAPRAFDLAGRTVARDRGYAPGLLPVVASALNTDICFVSCPGVGSPETHREPGAVFRDSLRSGGEGPEMVVVPAGAYLMGSPELETGRFPNRESLPIQIEIPYRFAVGRAEITWDDWDACVAGGGCEDAGLESLGGDEGYGRENRPLINVTWLEAQSYVRWLSRETRAPYRLLSEAEWEYAARAGSSSRFSWGDDEPTCETGAPNGAAFSACHEDQTWPVMSFSGNAFGIFDMHGNVQEYVADCNRAYSDSYPTSSEATTLPTSRFVTTGATCETRIVRGGHFRMESRFLRSAYRNDTTLTGRSWHTGFRVARDLD